MLFPILAKIGEGVCPFQNPLEIPENTTPQRGSEIAVAPGVGGRDCGLTCNFFSFVFLFASVWNSLMVF